MNYFRVTALFVFSVLSLAGIANAQQGDHLIISNLTVPNANRLAASQPYEASVNIRTKDGLSVEIQKMCFFWDQEGPLCFDNWDMRDIGGRSVPSIALSTGTPGRYYLTAFIRYTYQGQSYYTNQDQTWISVR